MQLAIGSYASTWSIRASVKHGSIGIADVPAFLDQAAVQVVGRAQIADNLEFPAVTPDVS